MEFLGAEYHDLISMIMIVAFFLRLRDKDKSREDFTVIQEKMMPHGHQRMQ